MFPELAKYLVFLLVFTSTTINGAWATYRPVGKMTCVRARNYPLQTSTRQEVQDDLRASAWDCNFARHGSFPLQKDKPIWEIDGWLLPKETPVSISIRLQP